MTRAAGSFAPWALRLPSALMAVGTVAWVGWLGCRLQSVRAGAWAGLFTAGNVLFFQMGHQAVVDITLTAMVTLALGLAFLAESRPQALLIEPIHFWRRELHGQVEGGLEIPTEGSQSGKIWDRTPVLVVNRSALDLLSDEED